MTQPFKEWKVLPHGKLAKVDDNILTVTGEIHMPLTDLPRRMTVVILHDARLVIFNGIALDEKEMRALETIGEPAYLIVPNDHHRLDARIYKERYPNLKVVAPEGAREKVEKIVPVDTTDPDFGDNDVKFVTVPGTRGHEGALLVRGKHGTTLILNDVVGNMHDVSGFGGWFLKKAGFAGDSPQIPKVVKVAMIRDRGALRAQLLQWADDASLARILVSHGDPIEERPAETLRELAGALA
jgi:hypothetical protein